MVQDVLHIIHFYKQYGKAVPDVLGLREHTQWLYITYKIW